MNVTSQTVCAHRASQRQVKGQGVLAALRSFQSILSDTSHTHLPTSAQGSRCFFGPEPFPGKDILPAPHHIVQEERSLMAYRCLRPLGVGLANTEGL